MRYIASILTITVLLAVNSLALAAQLTVNLQGLKGPALENVQSRLDISKKGYGKSLSVKEIQSFYAESKANILQALQPYGYFKAKVQAHLNQHGQEWIASYKIILGEQLRVTNIIINISGTGKTEPFFQKYIQQFPLQKGQPLLIKSYNDAKQQLFELAQNQGYLRAKMLRSQVRIDLKRYTSVVIIYFDTGMQYYFGPVSFSKTPLRDSFLRRYVQFKNGDPYSSTDIIKLQDALSSSGYFRTIKVKPHINKAIDRRVPISVKLAPADSKSYLIGAGYGTDTSVRGTLGLDLNRVTDTGHQFKALLQASPVQSSFQARYIIPGANPVTDQYSIAASLYDLDLPNAKGRGTQLTGAYSTKKYSWQHTVSINALNGPFTIASNPKETSTLVYPSYQAKRVHADDVVYPHNGYSIDFMTRGGSKDFLSDVDFVQAQVKGKYIRSITSNTRLLLSGTLGITSISDINKLHPTLQYFAGGTQSLRGYKYHSLGPGRYLVVGSGEVQQRIYKQWFLSGFYDVGNVYNNRPIKILHDAGLGIVRVTALGPIRIGVAKPLSGDNKGLRLIFSMGPDL